MKNFLIFSICVLNYFVVNAQELKCGYDRESFGGQYEKWYEEAIELANDEGGKRSLWVSDTVFRIPIVFHVFIGNVRDFRIQNLHKMLDDLNADFRRRNSDTSKMRQIFSNRVGDPRIEFYLPDSTPDGKKHKGYILKIPSFRFGKLPSEPYSASHKMKFDSLGGSKPWDTRKFLNVWICDLTASNGKKYVGGFATPPKMAPNWSQMYYGDSLIDGVVLDLSFYQYPNWNSTFTHEVGHYLGLRHVSGDPPFTIQDSCKYDDFIFDTPMVNGQNFFTCDYSINSCKEGADDMPDMLENFMDYTGEECRNSFTNAQIRLMRYCLTDLRNGLFKMNITHRDLKNYIDFIIYPVPGDGHVMVDNPTNASSVLTVIDNLGRLIGVFELQHGENKIDLSEISDGTYTFVIKDVQGNVQFRSRYLKL